MAKKKKSVAKKKTPIQYKDTKGNTWSALPGEPNGGFKLPGSDKVFSWRGFIQWAEKNLPIVQRVEDGIVDAGPVDFDTALDISGGGPKARKKKGPAKASVKKDKATKKKKPAKKKAGPLTNVISLLRSKKSGRTKAEIVEKTGLSKHAVTKLLQEADAREVGKDGNSILYAI